jgi:hypothetical protein
MNQGQVKDWRDLCQTAASEQDPNKLMALVAEIIKALDDRNKRAASGAENAAENTKECSGSAVPHQHAVEHRGDTTCASAISL